MSAISSTASSAQAATATTTATTSSSANNTAIPAASHHLPPPLRGYRFLKHVRSALSHDTFLAQVDTEDGKQRKRGSGTDNSHKQHPDTSSEATKVIRVYALDYLRRDEECRFMLERECMAGRIASHPHLLTVEDVFASKTDLFVVEPYCRGGNLYEYMMGVVQAVAAVTASSEHSDGPLSQEDDSVVGKGLSTELVQRLARELLTGVAVLHKTCGLVHRNIKLETLFFDTEMRLRLGGFGLCAVLPTSAKCESDSTQKKSGNGDQENDSAEAKDASSPSAFPSATLMKLCCGSKHYAAPELIKGQPYDGEAVDAWACGVVLFAMLTGCFPFDCTDINNHNDNSNDEALFKLVCTDAEGHLTQHPALAGIGDPRAVDLVRNLLRTNPKVRYSIAEALEHPFLAE